MTMFCIKSVSFSTYGSLALGTPLFVKVPRPGDSEGTFSVFELKLPPVTTSLQTTQR